MDLKSLLDQELITREPASAEEIHHLARLVDRDLKAHRAEGLPPDWQFAIAYGAALQLVTIIIRAEGFRALAGAHHYATIEAFGAIAGEQYSDRVQYLQTCRGKRNRAEYDRAGEITRSEVETLVDEAHELKAWVAAWLGFHHPRLLPKTWRVSDGQA
ncbi:MAG: hypothetical protein GF393_05480 [Armatimonadia bacterium]|nr:hypothetical protein [Armatimonadia bacterium]